MELTFEQIISAVNGIVRYEQNDLGLELHRFTRNQEGFFYKTHPMFCKESFFNGYFAKNCRTSAGITLDFISDAKTFKIRFGRIECIKSNNPWQQMFDLYVDNAHVRSYDLKDEIIYMASGKKHRFTLYFPCYSFPIISTVELEAASVFLPIKKQIDILFLGDSITQGARAIHPSYTYVMRIARSMDIGILNQGNSGFVYDAESVEKVCEPEIIVTAYGINDFMRKGIQKLETDTVEFLKKTRLFYKNSKIISILPLWTIWDGNDNNFKKAERSCLKSVYEKHSDYIIDGLDMIPHNEKYFSDDVHPNDDGFKFYAENMEKEIKNMIIKDERNIGILKEGQKNELASAVGRLCKAF